MTPLIKTLLGSAVGAYLVVRSYQLFRNPSPDSSWFRPCASVLLAALAFSFAFESYRNRKKVQRAPEPSAPAENLTRTEKILFKAFGLPVIFVGLFMLGM